MEQEHETFTYAYSARQQEEVKSIRQKYLPAQEDKMAQLRRLDQSAERPGARAAIALGTVGLLMFGVGMCCTLVWTRLFALGVVIGVAGIIAMALALPVFKWVTRRRREKLAPQIVALADELMRQP